MDLTAWEIDSEERDSAIALSASIKDYCGNNPDALKVYSDAVAIDGEHTEDRDDAINITRDGDQIVVEVFIANPSAFITKDSPLDIAARKRMTSLYFPSENKPMLARELSEDALSLNSGKRTPAIRIETRISAKSGKIEKISYEQCLVEAQNLTYEEVSEKIAEGDSKFLGWSRVAVWLNSIRAKNSKVPILPEYDPESEVFITEEGVMQNVSPHVINSHLLVAETMILGNQSCAMLMSNLFVDGEGVYRTQRNTKTSALYTSEPRKHASLGIKNYTHSTSPNRRYADILVHRFLVELGGSFSLDLRETVQDEERLVPPYKTNDLKGVLREINLHLRREKTYHSQQRKETGQRWLEKIFPNTDSEKLKDFDPIGFSILLKSASEAGTINAVFAEEVKARIARKGGLNGRTSLIFPKDAVNLFRFAEESGMQDKELWQEIRSEILLRLADDSQMVDQVFTDFLRKIDARSHTQKASFISKPVLHSQSQTNEAHAAAIVVEYLGAKLTTSEFAIGFSPRPTETRAKLEFLRQFGEGSLFANVEPQLPREDKIYYAKKLYRENAEKRKVKLIEKGYEIEESLRPFSPNSQTGKPRGYKYDATIIKDGSTVLSVSIRRENADDAQRIGIETAILSLRRKGYVDKNEYSHTGLATFAGRLKNGSGISYNAPLIVTPKRSQICDYESWEKLIETLVKSYNISFHKNKKAIVITRDTTKISSTEPWKNIVDLISEAFPKSELVIQKDKLTFRKPPHMLSGMIRETLRSI